MKYKGYSVYDDQTFFDKYIQKRKRKYSPNELLEQPIIDALVGDVKGKSILDLGCGSGKDGQLLLKQGAAYYHGVDGSDNMVALAKETITDENAKIEKKAIEQYDFPTMQYDLVISRLVFHYIEHLESVFAGIYQCLKPNGCIVFSIEHPIITSCYDAYHSQTKRHHWLVDNYFNSGYRVNKWIKKDVIKYHRTIEEYFYLFKQTGFHLEDLRESKPIKAMFSDEAEYERRKRIPLFMIVKLKK